MYRDRRRATELLVRDAILGALRAEGAAIDGLGEPDVIERERPAPDFDFLLDGRRVGLEVTEFQLPTKEVQAEANARHVIQVLIERLSPLAAELQLGQVGVAFDYKPGYVPTKRRAEAQAQPLLVAVDGAMREMHERRTDRVELGPPVPWVAGDVHVWIVSRTGSPRVSTIHGADGDAFIDPVIKAFVADRAAAKARQTAGYERAILGVFHGWPADPDNLKWALRDAGPLPWWRVYLVDDQGATLVFEDLR